MGPWRSVATPETTCAEPLELVIALECVHAGLLMSDPR